MFRIKTDIRQFNCETKEKVEKLIRNWVIRPTDLVLDGAEQAWTPIGGHAEFEELFEEIRDLSDVEELSLSGESLAEESASSQDVDALEQELEELEQQVKQAPGAQIAQAGILKLRALKKGSPPEEDIPLPVPVAPAGVEGVAPQDEATQVFARDEDEESEAGEERLKADEPREPTVVVEPSLRDGAELVEPDEDEGSEPRLGRHDLPEELFLTNELSRSELIAPLEPVRDDLREVAPSVEEDEDTEAWEITQQIESPFEEESETGDAAGQEEESDVHAGWESMMELDEFDDLRTTGEFDTDTPLATTSHEEPSSPSRSLDLDDTEDELDMEEIFSSPTAAPPSLQEPSSDVYSDDADEGDVEGDPAEDAQSAPRGGSDEEFDVLLDEGEGSEGEERGGAAKRMTFEDTAPLFQDPDFISEGYSLALPFTISPAAEDLDQGVVISSATDEEKDMAFPRPQPKKLGELIKRRYGYSDPPSARALSAQQRKPPPPTNAPPQGRSSTQRASPGGPPKDYSRVVAIFALVLLVLLIATLIILFK